ncbi:MAG: hypothetical protein IJB52_12655 [Clostridia bacterium]|nr:hypothetical protein [Clostridia bacterium]
MLKKNLFLISALICLLALGMTSCDTPTEQNRGEQSNSETVQTETKTAETKITPDLPDITFDGATFHLMQWYRGEGHVHNYFEYYSDELNGELLNDAIYNRNMRLQEKYDICITQNGVDAPAETVAAEVLAGSCEYHMVAAPPKNLANASRNGTFMNIHTIPYMDISKPWWNNRANEAFSVNDKLYFISGDLVLYEKQRLPVIFYNRTMTENYQIENLYDVVDAGKWTVDVMNMYANTVSNDTNGDGMLSWENDTIGFLSGSYTYIPFLLFGMENTFAPKIDDNTFNLNASSERMISSIEKIGKILYSDNVSWREEIIGKASYTSTYQAFQEGRFLFFHEVITVLRNMEMDDAFGVLPQPKYDEAQENYLTTVQYENSGTIAVPASGKDLEMTGVILEAMAYDSSESVLPVFIENILQSKKAPDQESSKMLEIVFKNIIYDLFGAFDIGGLSGLIADNIYNKHGDGYTALIESQKVSITTDYEKLVEDYSEIDH